MTHQNWTCKSGFQNFSFHIFLGLQKLNEWTFTCKISKCNYVQKRKDCFTCGRIYQNFDFTFLPGVLSRCNISTPFQMPPGSEHPPPLSFIHTQCITHTSVRYFLCAKIPKKNSLARKKDVNFLEDREFVPIIQKLSYHWVAMILGSPPDPPFASQSRKYKTARPTSSSCFIFVLYFFIFFLYLYHICFEFISYLFLSRSSICFSVY